MRQPAACSLRSGPGSRSGCSGYATSKLSDEDAPEQLSIFDIRMPEEPDEKHKRLKQAMDELNRRFRGRFGHEGEHDAEKTKGRERTEGEQN